MYCIAHTVKQLISLNSSSNYKIIIIIAVIINLSKISLLLLKSTPHLFISDNFSIINFCTPAEHTASILKIIVKYTYLSVLYKYAQMGLQLLQKLHLRVLTSLKVMSDCCRRRT